MAVAASLTTTGLASILVWMQLATLRISSLLAVVVALSGCDPVTASTDAAPPAIDAAPAPTCESYCATNIASCTGEHAQYGNEQVCVAHCETFGMLPLGTADDTSGHTVGCRAYHSTVAVAQNAPAVHCPHAGPSGGDVCGSWCENYCHLAMLNCTGSVQLYSTLAECTAACSTIPVNGKANDTTGDTVQCRIHHLGLAGTEPPTSQAQSCPEGRTTGNTLCTGLPPNP